MDNSNRTLEDLLNLTDTEDSSSSNSGLFDTNQQFVLELHDIKKDEPQTENAQTDLKIKKRRKKRAPTVDKSATSTSSDVSDTAPKLEDLGKEQFFDASGSQHELPENQAKPAATAALAQAHSEHGQDPKVQEQTAAGQKTSATPKKPSTVTKPVAPPDA